MVDAGRVRSLLDRVASELDALRRLAAMDDDQLRADPERLPGVKYRLQVAVEACIDTAEHTIASDGFRAPESFADAFTVLGEQELIGRDLQAALEDAARFRNLIVHGYATVDDRRVIEILRTRLDDLNAFRRAVAGYVRDDG